MMHPVLTVMQMFLPLRLPSLLQRECGGWVPSIPGHRGHHWPQVGHLGCLMFGAVSGWSRERARKWMINETLSSGFYTCARKVSPSLSLCVFWAYFAQWPFFSVLRKDRMRLVHIEIQSSPVWGGGLCLHSPVSKELRDSLEPEEPGLSLRLAKGRGQVLSKTKCRRQ